MKWISVKKNLPGDSITVLAYSKDAGRCLCYYIYEVEKWFYDNIDSLEEVNITHWMPLPDPPEDNHEQE